MNMIKYGYLCHHVLCFPVTCRNIIHIYIIHGCDDDYDDDDDDDD
jgi:hypothetical protein